MRAITVVALLVVLLMACRLTSPTIPLPTQDVTITTVKSAATFHTIATSPSQQDATPTVTAEPSITLIPAITTPVPTSNALSSPTLLLIPSKQNVISTAVIEQSITLTPTSSPVPANTIAPSLTSVVVTMTHVLVSPTLFLSPTSKATLSFTPSITPTATPSLSPTPKPTLSLTPTITRTPTRPGRISLTRVIIPTVNPARGIVGAIRWDAWVGEAPTFGNAQGDDRIGLVVERTLGPDHWHYRLPFFAVKLDKNKVQVRGNTQKIIDQEILYAVDAGLDYWAFNYYSPGSGLDSALKLYLRSPHRNAIKFSLILAPRDDLLETETRQILTNYFKMPNYQTVLNGRPLVYILGNSSLTQEMVDNLRVSGTTANHLKPYLVYLGSSATQVKNTIEKYHLDAGSDYAQQGEGGQPFVNLAMEAEKGWNTYRQSGIKVIPWVTTGWDPRPRMENSTPWITYSQNSWVQPAKPIDIARHLRNALQWNVAYPDIAETKAILIYAWNEFDEGGWLCPTLYYGTNRLDAIRKIRYPNNK